MTASTTKSRGGYPWISRKLLFQWHSWLGITFGALLFVICFSGSAAVVSHEIDWLLDPALRVVPSGTPKSWNDWRVAAEAARPDWRIRWISAPMYSWSAADVVAESPHGQMHHIYINPYTAAVQGTTTYFNVQRFLRDFHRMLNFGVTGLLLVSGFGFLLLTSTLSGLLFYRNWWKQLFQFRIHKGFRAIMSDLHRIVGIWSLLFALLIAVTGIWYFVEEAAFLSGYMPSEKATGLPKTDLAAAGPNPVYANIDPLLERAQASIPSFEVRSVWFPLSPQEPMRFDGQATAWFVRDRANQVLVNPYSGQIVGVQPAESLGALERWQDTVDPLHFGNFAGLGIKLLWALLGLAIPVLVITGAVFTFRKGYATPVRLWPLTGQSVLSLASLVVLLFAAHACYGAVTRFWIPDTELWSAPAVAQAGPWNLRFSRSATQLRIANDCGSCQTNVKSIALKGQKAPLRRKSHDWYTPLPSGKPTTGLRLVLTDWQGTTTEAQVPAIAAPNEAPSPSTEPVAAWAVWPAIAALLVLIFGFLYWWHSYVLFSARSELRRLE